jgi:hypothetical protein
MGIAIITPARADVGFAAGTIARGEFHCTGCGYGVSIRRVLPPCPMCQGTDWRPFAGRGATADDVLDTHA